MTLEIPGILKTFFNLCSASTWAFNAIKKIGIDPVVASSGGGSDINVFNSKGKRAVNLSSGMEDVHTNTEYVKISQLEKLAQLIFEISISKKIE